MVNKIEIVEEEIAKEDDEIYRSKSLKDRFTESVMKYQPLAEKAAAIVSIVDSVIDPFNNTVNPHTPFVNDTRVSIYETDDKSKDDLSEFLKQKGYEIENNLLIKVADVIYVAGSDDDEALMSLEEKKKSIDDRIDAAESAKTDSSTSGGKNNDVKITTAIDNSVIDIDRLNLPDSVCCTFKDSCYRTVQTTEDITLYRVYGDGAEKQGCYLTTQIPKDRMDSKVNSALLAEWNNSRKYYCEVEVPKGTILNIGKVAEQKTASGDALIGGADQILVSPEFAADSTHYKNEHTLDFTGNYHVFSEKAKKIENQ